MLHRAAYLLGRKSVSQVFRDDGWTGGEKTGALYHSSRRSVVMLSMIGHAILKACHRSVSEAHSDVWIFVFGITLAITLLSVLPS